ncbi:hypothetical protein [Leptolyngbya sp. FACHB-16]|uniref:hypothetical protein n=1 Tax=unclassified Leptolyngbya TaxID=2650499 RepID=UPI0019A32022|nr:hypothetical protein [Leptolyngbya sp. FACHB-16]MBD2155210.1 hypothetical protein [Leptolyngbya sp. FACHB-16]
MQKATNFPWRSSVCFLLAIVPLLTTCRLNRAMTFDEIYPPPWKEKSNGDISNALTAHNVPCPQYRWRRHINFEQTGEVFVHCSTNGSNWNAYLVFIPTYKVIGPLMPDPSLPVSN